MYIFIEMFLGLAQDYLRQKDKSDDCPFKGRCRYVEKCTTVWFRLIENCVVNKDCQLGKHVCLYCLFLVTFVVCYLHLQSLPPFLCQFPSLFLFNRFLFAQARPTTTNSLRVFLPFYMSLLLTAITKTTEWFQTYLLNTSRIVFCCWLLSVFLFSLSKKVLFIQFLLTQLMCIVSLVLLQTILSQDTLTDFENNASSVWSANYNESLSFSFSSPNSPLSCEHTSDVRWH